MPFARVKSTERHPGHDVPHHKANERPTLDFVIESISGHQRAQQRFQVVIRMRLEQVPLSNRRNLISMPASRLGTTPNQLESVGDKSIKHNLTP